MTVLSCKVSRETFSGRSSESTIPYRNRRYSGKQLAAIALDEDALRAEAQAMLLTAETEQSPTFVGGQ